MSGSDLQRIVGYLPQLAGGVELTVLVGIAGITLATMLAALAAIAHHSPSRSVRITTRTYIELARATPDLVQIFIWYYLLADIHVVLPPIVAGIVALGVGQGGSLAEVFRGGIEGVDRTQWDAASVLGLTRSQTWVRIVLPQVVRIVLPVWTGYLVSTFKATAFLSLIAVPELLGVANEIADANFRFFEVYAVVLVIYAVLGYSAVLLVHALERKWRIDRPRGKDRLLAVTARVA